MNQHDDILLTAGIRRVNGMLVYMSCGQVMHSKIV